MMSRNRFYKQMTKEKTKEDKSGKEIKKKTKEKKNGHTTRNVF